MRDIKNNGEINVQGNLNFTDNSQCEHKLFIHCSNEELLQELPFREENIEIEQKRKLKKLKPYYSISLFLLISAAGLATWNGSTNLVSFFLGTGSLFVGYLSLKATIEPNEFQIEEKNVVKEIHKILKQRRVR